MKNIRIVLTISLLAFATASIADIYKWVDANGKVHYSNAPPPDVNGKKVKIEPQAPTAVDVPDAAATSAYWKAKDEEFRKRQDEKYQIEKSANDKIALEDAEKRKKACEFHKKDFESVLNTRRHVVRSADGNEILEDPNGQFLNNGQRGAAIAELENTIAKECK